jgi:phosphoenolpyruvate carboxylase
VQRDQTAEQPGADKDAPLKRHPLLGRLLGDVLRDQEGEEVFAVVETIRQTAVRFRREADAGAAKELDGMLKILTREQTIRWCAPSPTSRTWPTSPKTSTTSAAAAPPAGRLEPQQGSVAFALCKLKEAGVSDTVAPSSRTLISPVLTAHDRGAAQEHPRRRARHRPPAGRARPAADAEGTAANLHLLRAHRHAVADACCATPS